MSDFPILVGSGNQKASAGLEMTECHIRLRGNSWEEMHDTSATIEKRLGASSRRHLGYLFNTIRVEFEVTREDPGLQGASIRKSGCGAQSDLSEFHGGVERHRIGEGDRVEARLPRVIPLEANLFQVR